MGTQNGGKITNSESDKGQTNVRTFLSPFYSYFVYTYVCRVRERRISFDVTLTSLQ
jgi:hypothetical protein